MKNRGLSRFLREVVDMPVTVAVDSTGESVHQTGPAEWRVKIADLG